MKKQLPGQLLLGQPRLFPEEKNRQHLQGVGENVGREDRPPGGVFMSGGKFWCGF
jgi:hypothetical protein